MGEMLTNANQLGGKMEVDSKDTPKLIIDELSAVGVKTTGLRHVDIPNFWAVMRVLMFATISSPKYAYYEAQLVWKHACKKPHYRLIKGEWVKQ